MGSTSTDSPQTVTVANIGNQPLVFTGLSYPTDFPEGSDANPCTATTSLAAGLACDVPINFTPQNQGSPLRENVTLTDNALNATGAQQSIAVSGTAEGAPTITSANKTVFLAGTSASFTVTTTGAPAPGLSEAGALPTGVIFNDNGNGTATISGTPSSGTGGVYYLTITASNGVSPNATQTFMLTVDQPASIDSAASTTFTAGSAGSFTVTSAAGTYPSAQFSTGSSLPSGVTLNNAGFLSGTPAAGTGGTYPIQITAMNGVPPPFTQSFTLTVNEAPAFTSANSTTFAEGSHGAFSLVVSGYPNPTPTYTGTLPNGVTIQTFIGGAVIQGFPARPAPSPSRSAPATAWAARRSRPSP